MKNILVVFLLTCCLNITSLPQNQSIANYNIGEKTFFFKDINRNRKLITEVWYPTQDTTQSTGIKSSPFIVPETITDAKIAPGIYPVILFSHGTGGNRLASQWFCAGLAKSGYIVAAVDHFGNTFDNPIPIEFIKFWERPQDLTFILNQLLNEGYFKEYIDSNRIGAAGFSLGGYTVIAAAGAEINFYELSKYFKTPAGKKEITIPEMPGLSTYLDSASVWESYNKAPDLYDIRIKCIFAMAPAGGQGFTNKEQFKRVKIPVYIIDTENDSIAPVLTNASHYGTLIKSAKVEILKSKAGHYVFLNEATDALKQQAPVYFKDSPSVNRIEIHNQVLEQAVKFFDDNLK